MTLEELQQLEEGTLLKIKGDGFFGRMDQLTTYRAASVKKPGEIGNKNSGYKIGCTLYPLDWISLATKKDVDSAIQKLTEEYHRDVNRLEDAFQKAQNARERLKR